MGQDGVNDTLTHFVHPIEAKRVSVFDARVETIAYSRERRILEIAFKSGQVWQLFNVPPDIHDVLQDSTIFIPKLHRSSVQISTCEDRHECSAGAGIGEMQQVRGTNATKASNWKRFREVRQNFVVVPFVQCE
ncbi:MAG TPA: KTSC domain-containing protein [Candidatus Udaeobacter sp.]|nr:KTSC domain-containing protein [Candidatus Udaeobacter sp.]